MVTTFIKSKLNLIAWFNKLRHDYPELYQRSVNYLLLMRFHRPIGLYLLLWPTLWGLWVAAEGFPNTLNLVIFVLGVIVMRSAGCVINDYADRDVDGYVSRTKDRPLVSGQVAPKEALYLFLSLIIMAFLLVLMTNTLTIMLSLVALLLVAIYPFMKRYTYMPQVVLGAAFAWAIPMAFAAENTTINPLAWLLFVVTVIWTVSYDTVYAMVDREDDVKIGIKSTAILLDDADCLGVGVLQGLVVLGLFLLGSNIQASYIYYLSVCVVIVFFSYQQYLIKDRIPERCFKAFLHNHWVGLTVFIGLLINYW